MCAGAANLPLSSSSSVPTGSAPVPRESEVLEMQNDHCPAGSSQD